MPHVDIELEENKQFISNIPRRFNCEPQCSHIVAHRVKPIVVSFFGVLWIGNYSLLLLTDSKVPYQTKCMLRSHITE